jgi:hypothetical protein
MLPDATRRGRDRRCRAGADRAFERARTPRRPALLAGEDGRIRPVARDGNALGRGGSAEPDVSRRPRATEPREHGSASLETQRAREHLENI